MKPAIKTPMVAMKKTKKAARLLVITALVTASPARADEYEDAFREARSADEAGDARAAIAALARALPLYPQDYSLPLEIAYRLFLSGRYEEAERHYRLAMERSPGAVEARLGLAASIEAEGRCDEARPLYEAISRESEAAKAGVVRCKERPAWTITPSLSITGVTSPGHAYKSLSGSVMPGLAFGHEGGFVFGAAYRFGRFAPASASSLDAWSQHEAYATIGFQREFGGIFAHYGFVYDGSGALGASHHVGFTGRLSPFGDIELRGSASFYTDAYVLRAEPSWRIPIAGGVSIRPALGIQYAAGEARLTGMGTLSLDRPRFSLFAGGKYGAESRPVYFTVPVVYDTKDEILYGAWGGGSVNVSEGVRIHLTYALDRMRSVEGAESNAHALTLGVAVSF